MNICQTRIRKFISLKLSCDIRIDDDLRSSISSIPLPGQTFCNQKKIVDISSALVNSVNSTKLIGTITKKKATV
ncbi:hypothetical protein D1AOALGA4SA_9110 [Olavius algarvensis Delta 1 endosymbiont]|nr:hypothetical protein D1AOALGA4SA_9110 [Olavius algarvensis Delta 1 endosymbiont]